MFNQTRYFLKKYKTYFLVNFVGSELRRKILQDKIWVLKEINRNPNTSYSINELDNLKCIFFHIPKTAGLSVCEALFNSKGIGHVNLKTAKLLFGQQGFDNYYKFCFVRNPWDRAVSSYHYLKGGGINKTIKPWIRNNILPYADFKDFVKNKLQYDKNIQREKHFRPQYTWICDSKLELQVDFVGKFENLNNDFQTIASNLKINNNLPIRNSSRRKNYKIYYDNDSRAIIANLYQKDIELFQYDFDNNNLRNDIF